MMYVGTANQMRAAENELFSQGITPIELMGSVGRLICDKVLSYRKILIVCGKGNNGGDGYAAAVHLHEKGKDVTVLIVSDKFTDSSLFYYSECKKIGIKCIHGYKQVDISQYDLILDCLFGIGFHGKVNEDDRLLIKKINAFCGAVISVDIPSGLNANCGTADIAVEADKVLTVGFAKYGLFLNAGKDYAKSVEVIPLGFSTEGLGERVEAKDFEVFLAKRKNDSHKGMYGYVSIFGGSLNYSGAIKLANLACIAVNSGSGVVRLAVPDRIMDWVGPYLLESTLFSENDYETVLKNASAVGIGCGWGRDYDRVELLNNILSVCHCPVILDADGLFAWKKLGLKKIDNLIITPHYAEMAHIADLTIQEVRNDPVGIACSFAGVNHCITVLKGPSTIVTDGNDVYICDRGCAGMATAGSGDVLLGIMTSIVGQKFDNMLLIVSYATFINGISGELAQKETTDIDMTSRDTVDHIKHAYKFLRKSCGIN